MHYFRCYATVNNIVIATLNFNKLFTARHSSEYFYRQHRRQEGETHWPLWSHMVYICKTILYATWHEDVGCLMIERRIYKHTHNRSGRFIIIIYSSITHVGWLSTEIHRNNCAETDVWVSRSRMKKHFFFFWIWTLHTGANVYYASTIIIRYLYHTRYLYTMMNRILHFIYIYITYFVQVYKDIGLFNNTVYIYTYNIKCNVHIYKYDEKVQ